MKWLFLIILVGVLFHVASSRNEITKVTRYPLQGTRVDSIITLLIREGIQNPIVVLAQMILETATFKSKIFRENHNIFGMKKNKRRFNIGEKNGHAAYPSLAESLLDYQAWQKMMLRGRTLSDEEYIDELGHMQFCGGCRYAEDPLYETKLRILVKKIRACITVDVGTDRSLEGN